MNKELGHTDPQYRTYRPKQIAIRHYYGDLTRQILLGAAALMLIGAPFYTSNFKVQVPFIVIGAIVIVGLAALMNPSKRVIAIATATASGLGAVSYELWALWFFSAADPIAFVLRQACAILLVFAFYFSLKTVRSMLMGLIGHDTSAQSFAPAEDNAREDTYDAIQSLDGLGNPAAPEVDKGGD